MNPEPDARTLRVLHVGRMAYRDAWALQDRLVAAHHAGEGEDTLVLVEHPPVVTLGRDARREHVLASAEMLAARGIEVVETDRGGDATYHGPGQLVGYAILDLRNARRDIRRFVDGLERTMIDTVADYGLHAATRPKLPGVWLAEPERKIGALGARVRRWVTNHGFALNVNTALEDFELIVPCGLRDKGVTSLARELGRELPMAEVAERAVFHFARAFERTLRIEEVAA